MTLTNWMKDEVLAMIKDWLKNNFTKFAIGTGITPEDSSQTKLENEVFRDNVDEIVESANSVLFRCYLTKTEANGYVISEFGLFDVNNNMLLRKVFGGISKTSDIDIWFEVEVVISVT